MRMGKEIALKFDIVMIIYSQFTKHLEADEVMNCQVKSPQKTTGETGGKNTEEIITQWREKY